MMCNYSIYDKNNNNLSLMAGIQRKVLQANPSLPIVFVFQTSSCN